MFHHIFSRKNNPAQANPDGIDRVAPVAHKPKGTGRSFSAFEKCDASIKVWLPEQIEFLLTELSVTHESSDNGVARSLLFVHLYGLADFEAMRAHKQGWFKPSPPRASVSLPLFSRPLNNPYPELGKNIYAMRLWMPALMRRDLQAQADAGGEKVSPYVRGLLIRTLLGARYRAEAVELAGPPGAEDAEKDTEKE